MPIRYEPLSSRLRTTRLRRRMMAPAALVGGLLILSGCIGGSWSFAPANEPNTKHPVHPIIAQITLSGQVDAIGVDPSMHDAYAQVEGNDGPSLDRIRDGKVSEFLGEDYLYAVAVDPGLGVVLAVTGEFLKVVDRNSGRLKTTIGLTSDGSSVSTGGIVVDQVHHIAYIATYHSDDGGGESLIGRVEVVDLRSHRITATVPTGEFPKGEALDATDHTLYVSNYTGSSVTAISTTTNKVVATIPIPHGRLARGLAVDEPRHRLWVIHDYGISIVDTRTNRVVRSGPETSSPEAIAIDPSTHTAFITRHSGEVAEINTLTDKFTEYVTVGEHATTVVIDSVSHHIYVLDDVDNEIVELK